MLSYYCGAHEDVLRGPPHVAIRMLVAPVLVASTVCCSGRALRCSRSTRHTGRSSGCTRRALSSGLAPFGLDLLTRVPVLLHALRRSAAVRVVATTLSVVAGAGLAVLTLPAADHLQDNVTLHAVVDGD